MKIRALALVSTAVLALAVSGCSGGEYAEGAGTAETDIAVTSTDDACDLSATSAPSGEITFTVQNDGEKETEFYLLGADKQDVVSEVEGIGPDLSKDMTVTVKEGTYYTSCKPGMEGDGIVAEFTVTQ